MRWLVSLMVVGAGCGGEVAAGGGGGGGSGAAGSQCEMYRRPETSSVEVRLTNATDAPVYVATPGGGCEFVPGYTVESSEGARLAAYLGECQMSCSMAQDQSCGCFQCGDSGVIMLHPGGTYVDTWSGLLHQEVDMPAACSLEPGCADGCYAEIVPDEPLIFVGTVHATADCDPGYCECEPSAQGWCEIPAAFGGTGEPTIQKATWSPGQSVVELVIQ